MNLNIKNFLIFSISIAFLTSCSIQKRLYSRGYHIEWNNKKHLKVEKLTENKIARANSKNLKLNPEVDTTKLVYTAPLKANSSLKVKEVEPQIARTNNYLEKTDEAEQPNASADEPATSGMTVMAFVLSLVGLFIFGIIAGILAIILGGISITRIQKNPEKYKGTGLAIAAIIIGIVDVVAVLYYISTSL